MSIRVFQYGLLPPTEGAELVLQQMRAAHRYRNTLVEIERGRRAAQRALLASQPTLALLEADVEAAELALGFALERMRASRKQTRSRSETAEQREEVAAARTVHRATVGKLREARKAAREDVTVIEERKRIDELANELRRNARAYCGVYWGTYLRIEAADDQARGVPLYDGAAPNDPRFMAWRGEGNVGVQIQKGLATADVSASSTLVRVEPVSEQAWYAESRGERRRASGTFLWLRVGSDGRAPVWARWPMKMHRPLPKDSVIKWVVVSLRRHGPREEWTVAFTVDIPDGTVLRAHGEGGAVAVELGWRVMADELRVAVWRDTDGMQGELRLPKRLRVALEKPDELRSLRDEKFNACRTKLGEAVAAISQIPDWLKRDILHLGQWRSIARLAALTKKWAENRFEGDADAYNLLSAWRARDVHLWSWEAGTRRSSLRWRREIYRTFAADLAARYQTVVLKDLHLSAMARKPDSEEVTKADAPARVYRTQAAISELRSTLQNAFGSGVFVVSSVDTTRTCHACGVIESFNAAEQIDHACRACGAVWDQDVNAAIILLERWRNAPPEVAVSTPSGSRWSRSKARIISGAPP